MDREQEGPVAVRLDEPDPLVHQEVGQRALGAAGPSLDLEFRVDRPVAAGEEAEEAVEALAGRMELGRGFPGATCP